MQVLGVPLPYDSAEGVRGRLADVAPHFALLNGVQRGVWLNGEVIKSLEALAAGQRVASGQPLASPISNFYMTDAISRASTIMAKCVQSRMQRDTSA
jgi:NADH dehydrogenase (ubiquinone) Fe-S protein 1